MTTMMTDNRPMTAEQAATLKRLAKEAYELDAFKPNLTRAEADKRIAMLTAKLKLAAAYALRRNDYRGCAFAPLFKGARVGCASGDLSAT
jgi:hypothetical protein